MRTKTKVIEECATLFEIEVLKETIDKSFEEVYGEITRIAKIPGFRAGKAPRELVVKHYTKDAKDEVLKRLIPEAYKKALEEHKINPLGLPEITDLSFEDGKALSFKARVDTRPKFKVKDYKGLNLEKKKVAVTDEAVDKTVESMKETSAKYIAIEDRPVQMGDYVVGDLECSVDGKEIHKKRENLWLYIDKEFLIPALSEQMVGMKKGEEREIEAMLPEKYPDKKLVGKTARYRVLAKEIKVRELPSIDDEFAKLMGRQNLEDLKSEVRKELEARALVSSEIEVENKLLTRLMDENVFPVPSSFVKRQIRYMTEDAKERLLEKGFKADDLAKRDDEFREKFREDAVRRVRLMFVLDEIASIEKIDVKDDDIKNAYKAIAAETGRTEEEIGTYYEKEGLVDNLEEKLREEKTIRFLLKSANITET